jgi:hypothetical protein
MQAMKQAASNLLRCRCCCCKVSSVVLRAAGAADGRQCSPTGRGCDCESRRMTAHPQSRDAPCRRHACCRAWSSTALATTLGDLSKRPMGSEHLIVTLHTGSSMTRAPALRRWRRIKIFVKRAATWHQRMIAAALLRGCLRLWTPC